MMFKSRRKENKIAYFTLLGLSCDDFKFSII